jgi:hypothetical protein
MIFMEVGGPARTLNLLTSDEDGLLGSLSHATLRWLMYMSVLPLSTYSFEYR